MMVRRWPDTLPTPSAPGFGLTPVDQSIRTNMEIGAQRVRRRTNSRLDRFTVALIFTPFQMDAFRTWHESLPYSAAGASDDLAAGWIFTEITRAADAAVGPDGTISDRILETSVNAAHTIVRTMPAWSINNQTVQFMVSLKPAGRTLGRIQIIGRDGVNDNTLFDLGAGTLGTQAGLVSRSIVSRGNGWWRIMIAANLGAGGATPILRLGIQDDSNNANYAGDIAKGFDVAELSARVLTGSDLFLPTDAAGAALGSDGGSSWFYMPLVQGSTLVSREARFVGPYQATAKAGLNWSVTAELEVRNA